MFAVEVAAVRQFVFNEGKSRREAARVFGLNRETIAKMCWFSPAAGVYANEAGGEAEAGSIPVREDRPVTGSKRASMTDERQTWPMPA